MQDLQTILRLPWTRFVDTIHTPGRDEHLDIELFEHFADQSGKEERKDLSGLVLHQSFEQVIIRLVLRIICHALSSLSTFAYSMNYIPAWKYMLTKCLDECPILMVHNPPFPANVT
jgi:hypothetical protein